jgi:hypothetical protein
MLSNFCKLELVIDTIIRKLSGVTYTGESLLCAGVITKLAGVVVSGEFSKFEHLSKIEMR